MEENEAPHIDPDFEPRSRPRSCTWPLPRPDISIINPEGIDSVKLITGTPPAEDDEPEFTQFMTESKKANVSEGATQRKSSSRRNAWGNQSYADLISQAIENSPEKRLTLAQIYDWMVRTVPYFKDKGDSNSSAGWKNSIRHNLSLHNKFLRVHNESTGKSSWWMLNPEGGTCGKALRRRAASMDNNSSKLLKSRMRAKQTKKQAGVTGPGVVGGSLPAEDVTGVVDADSSGFSQQFQNWGVNSCSPISHGTLEDPETWTSFRPRAGSDASTLSGRRSPVVLGQEDEDELPEDGLLGGYSAGSLPSTLMEELDLIDGLTLMIGQRGEASPTITPLAPPTSLPSAGTLLPCGFSSFPSQQPTRPPQHSSQTGTQSSISQNTESSSSFSNSLFNPMTGSSSQVPSRLEALLTSDSPPPCDVMMTQVDLLMTSQDETGLPGLGALMPDGSAGLHELGLFGSFTPSHDRLPTDLDIEMFTENLDCDVDYIINSDLMDGEGIDFNFDPILPTGQGYPGPTTTQGSSQNWVSS